MLAQVTLLTLLLLSRAELNLMGNNSFQIAVFSDLHYGEDEDSFGIAQDISSARLIRHVLGAERPDFAVLNGDLVTGENAFAFNSTQYVGKIVQPLVENECSWASTYGNHDSKYNLSREELFLEESKYANSYTQHGPPGTDGVTNYVLPLYGSAHLGTPESQSPLRGDSPKHPVALLYFIDSRGGSQNDSTNLDNISDFVTPGTALWLNSTHHALLQRHGVLPSLLFVHIPVQAFSDMRRELKDSKSNPYYPGMNAEDVNQQGTGAVGKNCCKYEGQDIPFMQTLLEMEGLHSIYSSHNHGDAWCGVWPNSTIPSSPSLTRSKQYASNRRPFLCFTKHSGFGGYGHWNRGSRQIQLSFGEHGMTVKTWVRMQWGGDHEPVVTSVTLNETYGKDVYAMEDGGYRPP
ncbi:MAG: hypothetical protein Q9162_004103 [Coniocarpon cinnabarinum]